MKIYAVEYCAEYEWDAFAFYTSRIVAEQRLALEIQCDFYQESDRFGIREIELEEIFTAEQAAAMCDKDKARRMEHALDSWKKHLRFEVQHSMCSTDSDSLNVCTKLDVSDHFACYSPYEEYSDMQRNLRY